MARGSIIGISGGCKNCIEEHLLECYEAAFDVSNVMAQ